MSADLRVFPEPDTLGAALADEVLMRYDATTEPYLLGCPGGRSLRSTYRALAEHRRTLDRLVVAMMDEYIGAPTDAHYSCTRFAHEEIAAGTPGEALLDLVEHPGGGGFDVEGERIARGDGVDNDCNGLIDEDCPQSGTTFEYDRILSRTSIGSVYELTDASAAVQAHYSYDAYGRRIGILQCSVPVQRIGAARVDCVIHIRKVVDVGELEIGIGVVDAHAVHRVVADRQIAGLVDDRLELGERVPENCVAAHRRIPGDDRAG